VERRSAPKWELNDLPSPTHDQRTSAT
jgi:hypothetical protein